MRTIPFLFFSLIAAGLVTGAPVAAQSYKPSGSVALGAPDKWDYVVYDAGRVYVAHGDRVTVVDGHAGTVIGEVAGIPGGTHGIAISPIGKGYTDDGKNGLVIAFDPKTLKITKQIPADEDADGMAIDKVSGHVFTIDGDPGTITVVDPKTDTKAATIKAGEKMEFPAADDHGALYVAGEAAGDLLKIDTRTNRVVGKWPAADCKSPHGLAVDKVNARVFLGCVNSEMIVLDGKSGKVVTKLAIGKGSDAILFDPVRKRVFSPNGVDGTITVYQQVAPDTYRPLPTIATSVSARTMALDSASGRLFVAGADTDPAPTPGVRAKVRPGTLRLMMFDPAN